MHAHIHGAADSVALFYHPASLEHDSGPGHPESAARLRAVLSALRAHGIPESALQRPQPAGLDLLGQVHDPEYIAAVEKVAGRGGGYWDYDTHISRASYEAALLGVGAAVAAVDNVMSGKGPAFALMRPPGHHAVESNAMGFCIFNNVAVAAHHATSHYGLERVLVVDWDVHHGNGTQDLLYSRPDVLFFSTHQYPFYPGTGAMNEIGSRKGRGYTVNVPLPAGAEDRAYLRVFHEVLVPLARRYQPQLILISAGYDAHIADPIGGMAITVAGFAELALIVRALADELSEGRVAAVLEGGYNSEALGQSVIATLAMLGEEQILPERPAVSHVDNLAGRHRPDVTPVIEAVKQMHGLE